MFLVKLSKIKSKSKSKRREVRVKVRLVNNAKDYTKYGSRPRFVSQKIFSINFVAIHEIKPVLTLDKPIYVGFSILYLSKFLKYEFHYNYIKTKYNVYLLFTDTDNLVLKQMFFMKIVMG